VKICLFGGTFDPPHLGHLILAQTIYEAEHFDQIVFVPAYKSPHKDRSAVSSVDLRKEMVKIAIQENPNFVMSEIEIDRGGVSYSIDTIIDYKKKTGTDSKNLFYLIGSDSLKTFHSWRNSEQILDECQIIVAIRPGFRPSDIDNKILAKVQFANIPRIEVSSTEIRRRWIEGKTIRYMVTQQIWEYINENKLYL